MDADETRAGDEAVVIYTFIYLMASERPMKLLEKKATTSNKHFPRNLIPLAYISGTAPYISNTFTLFSKNQTLAVINSSYTLVGPGFV